MEHDPGPYDLRLGRVHGARTGEITTMKLHKLCYYSQAWHLAWDGERLIDAEFHAWGMGPVNPDLYETHRGVFTSAAVNSNAGATKILMSLTANSRNPSTQSSAPTRRGKTIS